MTTRADKRGERYIPQLELIEGEEDPRADNSSDEIESTKASRSTH